MTDVSMVREWIADVRLRARSRTHQEVPREEYVADEIERLWKENKALQYLLDNDLGAVAAERKRIIEEVECVFSDLEAPVHLRLLLSAIRYQP